jgi:hypothetical protein
MNAVQRGWSGGMPMFGDMDQARKHPKLFIIGIVLVSVIGVAAMLILSF